MFTADVSISVAGARSPILSPHFRSQVERPLRLPRERLGDFSVGPLPASQPLHARRYFWRA
jgi:hypothetical protein